jgi:hypothetical protein
MVSIRESLSATKNIYFKLTDPVSIPGLKIAGDDIQLIFDETDKDRLIAFRIFIPGPDLQDNIFAYQKAYRLTNFLTLKSGKYVFHERPREFASNKVGQELKSIGKRPISNTLVNLNISDTNIQALIGKDSLINQQLSHFSNGLKAFEAANFGEAVKEFHQVIEDNTPAHLKNYKYLRHGLSHYRLNDPPTSAHLKNDFGITCVSTASGDYVDIGNPEVQVILEKEANYLRTEVFNYIDPKVGIKTD